MYYFVAKNYMIINMSVEYYSTVYHIHGTFHSVE